MPCGRKCDAGGRASDGRALRTAPTGPRSRCHVVHALHFFAVVQISHRFCAISAFYAMKARFFILPPHAFCNQEFSRSAIISTRNTHGFRVTSPARSLGGPQLVSGGEMASIHRANIFFHLLLTSLRSTQIIFPSQVNEKERAACSPGVRCTTTGPCDDALDPNPPERMSLPSFRSFPPFAPSSYSTPAPPLRVLPSSFRSLTGSLLAAGWRVRGGGKPRPSPMPAGGRA